MSEPQSPHEGAPPGEANNEGEMVRSLANLAHDAFRNAPKAALTDEGGHAIFFSLKDTKNPYSNGGLAIVPADIFRNAKIAITANLEEPPEYTIVFWDILLDSFLSAQRDRVFKSNSSSSATAVVLDTKAGKAYKILEFPYYLDDPNITEPMPNAELRREAEKLGALDIEFVKTALLEMAQTKPIPEKRRNRFLSIFKRR